MVTVLDNRLAVEAKPRPRHPEKAHRPDQATTLRKPDWLRVKAPVSKGYQETREIARSNNLITVCEEAGCPNIGGCWEKKHATFMIMGGICTRACAFCNVATGMPKPLDESEPESVGRAVAAMGLNHVVITSVTRDDLPDGGAAHFARVVEALRQHCPGVRVELLAPDFRGSREALTTVLASGPDILAHNLETVPRLYPEVRRGADYGRSLKVLEQAKQVSPKIITKSGLMLGLGEESPEIEAVLRDLRHVACDMLTLGQYLSPSLHHAPVARYVNPDEFVCWQRQALDLGFKSVAAGPLVRSSYKAPVFFGEIR